MRRTATTLAVLAGLAAHTGCTAQDSGDPAEQRAALPDIPYCDGVQDWPEAWAHSETRAVELIDELRARGADCGAKGRGAAAPAVRVTGSLTCAARVHAVAMAEQAHVGHTSPDGIDLAGRMAAVQYDGDVLEHLAAGPTDAQHVVHEVWRPRDLQCIDLLSASHIDIGLGLVGQTEPGSAYGTYWVVLLGEPT